ncbi:MAG TPA: CoA ester lyase [Gammaproteobacteria bacterium]
MRAEPDASPPLLRSMLFVPADSERKLARAAGADADALILDLEDSVVAARKPHARGLAADFLRERRARPRSGVWVRINAVTEPESERDLDAVLPHGPAGIVLPKPRSAGDVLRLAARLDERERRLGLEPGATRILPIATETPAALFALGGYAGCGPRLAALTWGAEDLRVALGAATNVDERGEWLPTYALARSLCLLAAAAARVPAIDTVFTDFADEDGLLRQAAAARRDGFVGKLAIHPAQVEPLNRAFTPSREAIAHAQRVVAAFAASESGTVALDGRMLDKPHLEHARRVLSLARRIDQGPV